jgi:hypothetical protein
MPVLKCKQIELEPMPDWLGPVLFYKNLETSEPASPETIIYKYRLWLTNEIGNRTQCWDKIDTHLAALKKIASPDFYLGELEKPYRQKRRKRGNTFRL